ncbi:RNA polymerase factor sigma-32 [Methylobrevis pamukkalensis]|uniref:RNA polymerase sigma factor n=1 Tax=Methylobrevis pamukkalensis TaxID=1439726 RepID=A0A1E3H0N8_9HYPH|nr:RNA polymerase factor sigma-32 [Methylobrevis pamukkalensis]ODN69879.1 RNA polymerase sigma factor RpoH [Methylobrevis pamukkalensis]
MARLDRENQSLIRAAMSAPYLERDNEQDLARRWRDERDEAALHMLTRSHMRMVVSMAGRFRAYGFAPADLIQEGHVGLLEAATRFDPDREVRFSTYAGWWIRAAMQDFVLRNWSIVRGGTSSAQKSLFFNLRAIRARIQRSDVGASDSEVYAEVAKAIGVSRADVVTMAHRLSGPDTSLNAPVSDEDGAAERMDLLVSDAPRPDELVETAIDGERWIVRLRAAMETLSERERRIVEVRRLAETAATLEEVGGMMGISKERVRQIEVRAMEKLRIAIVPEGGDAR